MDKFEHLSEETNSLEIIKRCCGDLGLACSNRLETVNWNTDVLFNISVGSCFVMGVTQLTTSLTASFLSNQHLRSRFLIRCSIWKWKKQSLGR